MYCQIGTEKPLTIEITMKKILYTLGVSLLIAGGAQAATVFTENFNGQSFDYTSKVGVVLGGASPNVAVGDWFAATSFVAINDELQFTNAGDNRGRGAGIWLDSSAWTIGTVTVKFDILDYVAPDPVSTSESFFQAYYANGVDGSSSTVSLDVNGNGAADPATAFTGSATIGTIGDKHLFTANATQAEYTFNFTGQENIALVFYNKDGGATSQPIFSVDNLTVNTVPEPATSGMLFGLVGLSALFIRRRKA
jgi:hypothetical protein